MSSLEQKIAIRTFPAFSYPSGSHWFVLYTNIRSEKRAQLQLDAKGFRTFLPESTHWVTHSRIRSIVKRPLLTRYLFIEMDPNKQSFMDVRATDGIEAIVGTTGTPMIIPSQFVDNFMGRQLAGEFDYAGKDPLTKGAKVKIVSGEFDDMIGVITSEEGGGALMVKLLKDRREVRLKSYAVRAIVN